MMKKQQGQVVLILILVMTVALAIGISVVQRSLSDISTATKVEESSRAFSAAEAGIEQALNSGSTTVNFTAENQSSATVEGGSLIPCVPGSAGCAQAAGTQQVALEFPPLSREQTAHVWLADYNSLLNPPANFYTQDKLDVYWGIPSSDNALELTVIYVEGSTYKSTKKFFAQSTAGSNFTIVTCPGGYSLPGYQCYVRLSGLPANLMMLTARMLYNSTSQPFAVQAVGVCGQNCSIPPQARVFTSTGTAGQTQRRIKLFQIEKVAPPYFDYGLFSIGEINK